MDAHARGFRMEKREGRSRASGGGFGVEVLDHIGVALLDDAALELQGVGQFPTVESEVVIKQSEALDGLVLGEICSEALDFGVDEVVDPRIFTKGGAGTECDASGPSAGVDGRNVGHDQ